MKKNNFHTHTYRCGHGMGSEEDMVLAAINCGIDKLGFSEHIPLPHYRYHILKGMRYTLKDFYAFFIAIKTLISNGPEMRMPFSEMKNHCQVVSNCKNKYQDIIKIYQGFEAEYFEEYLPYYQTLLDEGIVDYLILGNHFNNYAVHSCYYGKDEITNEEIIKYKDDLLKAMDTNLFSYVAHPDLFMIGKREFDDFCLSISQEICRKALEKDIPLEINAGGLRRGLRKVNDELLYPYTNSHFFDVVGKMGCKVVIGIDAHKPEDFNQEIYKDLFNFIKRHNLNVIHEFEFKKGRK